MLQCSKRAENIINRKVTIFYIETVLNFFFSTPKNNFSEIDRKKNENFLEKFQKNIFRKSIFNWKIDFFKFIFFRKKSSKKFSFWKFQIFLILFSISKKYFLVLKKIIDDSFDAENCVLSIPAVFMTIPALLAELSRINWLGGVLASSPPPQLHRSVFWCFKVIAQGLGNCTRIQLC